MRNLSKKTVRCTLVMVKQDVLRVVKSIIWEKEHLVVLIFPLNGQMAMLLRMVPQERFNFHHFKKQSVSTETQKRTRKLLIFLRRQRMMYSLI